MSKLTKCPKFLAFPLFRTNPKFPTNTNLVLKVSKFPRNKSKNTSVKFRLARKTSVFNCQRMRHNHRFSDRCSEIRIKRALTTTRSFFFLTVDYHSHIYTTAYTRIAWSTAIAALLGFHCTSMSAWRSRIIVRVGNI